MDFITYEYVINLIILVKSNDLQSDTGVWQLLQGILMSFKNSNIVHMYGLCC